jgi:drug/metabolite transporter (DMT)-like permease
LSTRKTAGVLIAMSGVAMALASGVRNAPPGAWRGDLVMAGATLCMAFYSVWSRPFIKRSSALGFLTASMGAGGIALVVFSLLSGDATRIAAFTLQQGIAAIAGGGALAFFLWVYALQYASPTRVTNTMTVNPLIASLSAAVILDEPITFNLIAGLTAVFAGLWIATSERPPETAASRGASSRAD